MRKIRFCSRLLRVCLCQIGVLVLLLAWPLRGASIPGLYNTGVNDAGALLAAGAVDPHWRLIQSDDPAAPGPNAVVPSAAPIPPWVAQGPSSQWIAPALNQSAGSAPGNYTYRLTFDLTGLEPGTAVITGRWSSDNNGPAVLLNGVNTGFSSDGNFGAIGNLFTISSGFIDGTNTLDFIVYNAPNPGANPTAFRCELSGTADNQPPAGTPPSIVSQPLSLTVGVLDPATFSVSASGSRPFTYQWRRDGTPIPGATGTSFTIPTVRESDAAGYDVIVSNSTASVTSMVARLTVVTLSPAEASYEPPGPSSRRTGLTFSEIMYHPAPNAEGRRTEFIEIYNANPFIEDLSGWRLTGSFDYTFPSNTVLQGNAYLVVAPVPGDVAAAYGISGVLGGSTNTLPNDSGTIRLRKRSGAVVLEVAFSDQPPWPVAADGTGHSLVLVRPSYGENNPKAWAASAFKGGSPGRADPVPAGPLENIVINEFLAHTDLPLADYIELFNNGGQSVDLSGCWLSDAPATNKFRIPDGTRIDGRGFVVFDEVQLGFSLEANGETLYLVNSNGDRVIDVVHFSGQANGVATGRYPDGAPGFQELRLRTPGAANAPPWQRDVVINEIYYNPISGDNDDQFIELYNQGDLPVTVAGWRFTAGVDFSFPPDASIPAGGYLVVARNASRLLANHPGLNPAGVVGDFGGTLAHGGERLALGAPETIVTADGPGGALITNLYYVDVDEVTYADGGRWGRWADGGGSSLELMDSHADNRAASNWADSDETAKAPWTVVEQTGVLDLGSGTADRVQIMLLGEGEALVDDVEVLVSGSNRVPNPGFESGTNGWIFGGTHSKTTLENAGFNSSHSLHLRASARGDLTVNRLSATLSSAVAVGTTATLRAKVRWLRGHPEILLRLKGNYLEAFGRLTVPANLGTPGAPSSQARANAGPAITEVAHRPVLPQANQAIRVTARVSDPDGLSAVTLRYRLDGTAGSQTVPMLDNGTGPDAVGGDGIFTGLVPGQPAGRLVAFTVEASDNALPPASAQFPALSPQKECLVRVGDAQPPGAFGVYHLWLTAATVSTWETREKLSNEDLDTTFVYGNTRVIYNAGAHYSGSPYTTPGYTSPVGALCGYDISLPADDAFLGSTHTILDWPVRDVTDQREQMMFWLLDQAGLPNMYRRYVSLFVNGLRRGVIYDDIQQPSGETVEEWFPDDSEGALFKPDCWDEFSDAGNRETSCIDLNALEIYNSGGVKKTARYRWTWKPRAVHGTANDYAPIFSLIDAANAPASTLIPAMESVADMEHWMRTFANNDLSSYWDAFGNPNAKNTFLYQPGRGGWKLMCWDMDVGLGASTVSEAAEAPNAALFPSLNDDSMNRIYATPHFLRYYWRAIYEAVNSYFQSNAVTALLASKYDALIASGLNVSSPFVPTGGNGTSSGLNPARSIPGWINERRNFMLTQLNAVTTNFAVNGPTSLTTSSNLVTLTGTAPVNVHTLTVNGVRYTPIWTSVTSWRLLIPVSDGFNQLDIAAYDRAGNLVGGPPRTISVTYTGPLELAEDNVVINEIMYNPVVPEASFIEIYNRSATFAFNLHRWRLNGVDFTFPSATVLPPRGFLVVAKNVEAFGRAYGWAIPVAGTFDGQLDDGGETISLWRPGPVPGQEVLVDIVTYDDDPPWPSAADGQGPSLQLIDPGQDNNRVSNWSDGGGWRFVSYTHSVGAGTATNLSFFFETAGGDIYLDDISLVLGDQPATGQNVLANGDFEAPLSPAWRVAGTASNSVITTDVAHSGAASLHLIFRPGAIVLANCIQSFPQLLAGSNYTLGFWYLSGSSGTNFTWRMNTLFTSSINPSGVRATPGTNNTVASVLPPFPPLWLSEVQPENPGPLADNFGEHEPWIELYNSGELPLSLDDLFLSDSYSNLAQWPFPAGTTINPRQFLLVWADGESGETDAANPHASFRLNPTNGTVALSRLANGSPQILDYLNYRHVGPGQSFGSYPDGQLSERQVFLTPTPRGTNNPATPIIPLFINEWMADNTGRIRDPFDQDPDDWFEIYNPATNLVDLAGFTLTDDPANPGKFTVPQGIRVPARGFLLVWADEESSQTRTNGDLHVNFKLSQTGEQIALYNPSGQLIDLVEFGRQTNDVSEGRWPDGAPPPFQRMTTPTPRQPNVLSAGEPRLTALAFLPAGGVRLTWSAQPGALYRVEYKTDLGAALWTELAANILATGTTASVEDPASATQRFYRVVQAP